MAHHLLLILISVLVIGTHSEARSEVKHKSPVCQVIGAFKSSVSLPGVGGASQLDELSQVYKVESLQIPDHKSSEKLTLICNTSEKKDALVYWMKDQEQKGTGTHLEITVKNPMDAGNYTCWNKTSDEILCYATVLIVKKDATGKIADQMLSPFEGTKETYFKCAANSYAGNFICSWKPVGQNSDLKFGIRNEYNDKTSGSIICEKPVKSPVGQDPETYTVFCRKQNSCSSAEEYEPIMMFLDVFYGFTYEEYNQTFFIKDIIKPDTSECWITNSGLNWTLPHTWSTPESYYGLTYQIKTVGQHNRRICEVDNTTLLKNGNILSCHIRLNSNEMYSIRSRDRYSDNDSAWSEWSKPCRKQSPRNGKPYIHSQDIPAKIVKCKCQKN
ncbi:interleukin-12 subunit beta [Hemicordylus capensis]|uniref:interleukin-12 subunit beta n=1 Tax=Hemicordylus capensis TaxID=884348 RepID=UPI002303001C|nr:interleukin-12 subunit beta [Hemicordylus capensis]